MNVVLSSNLQIAIKNQFNIQDNIQKAILKGALIIQNAAKTNAPYDTGTLRRSIRTDTGRIRQLKAIVGVPSSVPYGNIREHVNNLNPNRKYYMKRAKEDNEDEVISLIMLEIKKSLG